MTTSHTRCGIIYLVLKNRSFIRSLERKNGKVNQSMFGLFRSMNQWDQFSGKKIIQITLQSKLWVIINKTASKSLLDIKSIRSTHSRALGLTVACNSLDPVAEFIMNCFSGTDTAKNLGADVNSSKKKIFNRLYQKTARSVNFLFLK